MPSGHIGGSSCPRLRAPASRSPPRCARTRVGGTSWAVCCTNITRPRHEPGFVHPSGFRASSHDLPSPCRALRRALHSAHRRDATPHRDDATRARTPGRVAGARKGVFTTYVQSVEETARMVTPARRGHPELAWGNVVGKVILLLGLNL